MIQISEHAANEAISEVLCECFELFFKQRYMIEVLTNETKFYMLFADCKDCEYYNASSYFQYFEETKQYAFQRDKARIAATFYEFDTLAEAQAHAFKLLAESE